jgi:hypothetical protein
MFLVRIVRELGQLIGCEDEVWTRPGAEKEKSADDTLVFGLINWAVRFTFYMFGEKSVRNHWGLDRVASHQAYTAEEMVGERGLSDMSVTIITLDVHSDKARDGAVVRSFKTGKECCLEVRTELVVVVAEEKVVDMEA